LLTLFIIIKLLLQGSTKINARNWQQGS
jgi:hypothetical protein